MICIDTHLPREGPETQSLLLERSLPIGISTYLPREGPETIQVLHK